MPDLAKPDGETDFYFVPAADPEQAVSRIVELVQSRIPRRFGLNPIRDIQVLCPMNRGVGPDRSTSNCRRRSILQAKRRWSASAGPSRPATRSCRSRTTTTRSLQRGHRLCGGRGRRRGGTDSQFRRADRHLRLRRTRHVPRLRGHHPQEPGSEYPAVVIPVMTQHYAMLQRNLLYTGVTRGKQLVVLVGQSSSRGYRRQERFRRRRWSKPR